MNTSQIYTSLKSQALFVFDGVFVVQGIPDREIMPHTPPPNIITEQKFLIPVKKNLDKLTLAFQFYPQQKAIGKTEKIFQLWVEFQLFLEVSINEDNTVQLSTMNKVFKTKSKALIHEWNFIIISLDLQQNKEYDLRVYFQCQEAEQRHQKLPKFEGFRESEYIYGIFGSRSNQEQYIGLISNFIISEQELSEQQMQQLQIEYKQQHITEVNSKYDYQESILRPIRSLSELSKFTGDDLLNISRIPLRSVKRKIGESRVIVCHDMMNGYKEDNYVYGIKVKYQHLYRFNYWPCIEYFIYFSHERVSIPPLSYINVAHSMGVKVLATFITEGDLGQQENNILLTGDVQEGNQFYNKGRFYYADKLIEVCKYYKFDGYLLNFEAPVFDTFALQQWVRYLTDKIHEEVPGSLIIWYDSIIPSGQVQWQSGLNHNNKMFYDSSDAFFTDYKWDDMKIESSVRFCPGDQYERLFHGIDVFGRGSYQGGQNNLFKGIQKCKSLKTGIAIFAPGWTYESNDGRSSRDKFMLNDLKLWRGKNSVILGDNNSQWIVELNNGSGWKNEKEDGKNVSIASFDWCKRSLTVPCQQLQQNFGINLSGAHGKIIFTFQVKGTPPKNEDIFVGILECFDILGNTIISIDTFNQKIQYEKNIMINSLNQQTHIYMNRSSEDWKTYTLEINLINIPQQVKAAINAIKVSVMGRDVEYWAGHFGPRFTNEIFLYQGYDYQQDVAKMLKARRFFDPYLHTYLNEGQGQQVYINGEYHKDYTPEYYNNLGEYDINLCYVERDIGQLQGYNRQLVNDYEVKVINNDSWNGTSCIQVNGQLQINQAFALKLYKTFFKKQKSSGFTFHIVFKYTNNNNNNNNNNIRLIPLMKCKRSPLIELKQVQEQQNILANGWIKQNYVYNINQQDQQQQINDYIKTIYLAIENTAQTNIEIKLQIGEIGIIENNLLEQVKQINLNFNMEHLTIFTAKFSAKNIENGLCNQYYNLRAQINIPEYIFKFLKYIRVFKDEKWICNASSQDIFIENLSKNTNKDYDEFKFQVIIAHGTLLPLNVLNGFKLFHNTIQKLI